MRKKKVNTYSLNQILEQMEDFGGKQYHRQLIESTDAPEEIEEAKEEELETEDETDDEVTEESINEGSFNTNNASGKNTEEVNNEKTSIKATTTKDDSGKVSNEGGENSKDQWKLANNKAKYVMNSMGKFFSNDRSGTPIQFNEKSGKFEAE